LHWLLDFLRGWSGGTVCSFLASGQFVDDEIVVDIVRNLKEDPAGFMDG